MIIQGKFNNAVVQTETLDETTTEQIRNFLNEPFLKDEQIVIMPDAHAGKGAVIGTTMSLGGKVCPNLVGVDIGCGVLVERVIGQLDLENLDDVIHNHVPSGIEVHDEPREFDLSGLTFEPNNNDRILKSLGTLGGGNHFIEVGESKGEYYILIHTGSRNLGVQIAQHHQKKAELYCMSNPLEKKQLIKKYKAQGRDTEIEDALKQIKPKVSDKQLAYLEGDLLLNYFNDMEIAQQFAKANRRMILKIIKENLGIETIKIVDSVHNYIDFDMGYLRKGSQSAYENQPVVIPINMRDGSILGVGKGNKNWNYSAPHGAGRIMSRSVARKNINLDEFMESMKGVYTTSVNETTLDEAPDAYKPLSHILENIEETIEIVGIIKPVYNFKANGGKQ